MAARVATPFDQDGMFLLGFFSLLDAILDQSMDTVLAEIPLDPGIKKALVDSTSTDGVWIDLLDEIDRCNWVRLTRKVSQMGLSINMVSRLSADASAWTAQVMT